MTTLTYEEARDYILEKFKTAWDANSPAVNGGDIPYVEYQNVHPGQAPLSKGNKAWARITVRHAFSNQRSFGGIGQRIFTRAGRVMVQIFVPAGKQGLVLADRLGKVATDAFEGDETAAGSIWFRNVTYSEIGIDNNWFQVNVGLDFEYDTLK